MPRGDKTTELAFRLWLQRMSLPGIQTRISQESETQPTSVAGWVRDWERGAQRSWTPDLK